MSSGETFRPWRGSQAQALGVFFVFLLAAPPLAALAWLGINIARNPDTPLARIQSPGDASALFVIAIWISAFSYVIAGLQAGCIGAFAAWTQYRNPARRVPLIPVLLACVPIGAASLVAMQIFAEVPLPFGAMAFFFSLHFAAAMGCWLIANGLLRLFGISAASEIAA